VFASRRFNKKLKYVSFILTYRVSKPFSNYAHLNITSNLGIGIGVSIRIVYLRADLSWDDDLDMV